MSRCNMNENKLNSNVHNIHLHNFNSCNILNNNIKKISICCNNTTLNLGGLEIFGFGDNNKNKEEYLVEEVAKSYVINMGNQDTLL